jgi:hypothetical protein
MFRKATLSPEGRKSVTLPPVSPEPGARSPSPTKQANSMGRHGMKPLPAYSKRTATTGPYNSAKLTKGARRADVIDYSFMDLTEIDKLPQTVPRNARPLVLRSSSNFDDTLDGANPLKAARESALKGLEGGRHNTGVTEKTADGFLVMKAGEHTYAFKDEQEARARARMMSHDRDLQRFMLDADGKLVERQRGLDEIASDNSSGIPRYHAASLRLDNNQLTNRALFDIAAIVSQVAVNPLQMLTHIDLSVNKLTAVPPLECFPIRTLNLHCNRIASMKDVDELRVLRATLRKLTLNGNPVQELVKHFKFTVLHALPFLDCLDDVRVTPKDREKITTFANMFASRGRSSLLPRAGSPT